MSTRYDGPPGVDAAPTDAGNRPSIGELLSEVSQDLTTLLRQEVELAKAEVKQSATRAAKGAGMFAGAGLAGHMVLFFLSIAAWWGLGDSTGHGWSALIVAGGWLLIAAVLAVTGRGEIKSVTGVPQTADTVKKIPSAVAGNEETS
ncbi:MAG: phage holin family protein [Jatrophihabitans sp.]